MYERRLKILLGTVVGIFAVLLLRAAHLQIVQADHFRDRAAQTLRRSESLEAPRGSILDIRGRELAVDTPCLAAAVDYRAIDRNPSWIQMLARQRLGSSYLQASKSERPRLLAAECQRIHQDIDKMWVALAEVSGKSLEDIEQLKASIRQQVEMRRRYVWYMRYAGAAAQYRDRRNESSLLQWLLTGQGAPDIDSFGVEVEEQVQPHVILKPISTEVHNWLSKRLGQFPGLVLQRDKYRSYPLGQTACHVLGFLSAVSANDLRSDPNAHDPLLSYLPFERIGRTGIEALCDRVLRGSRGLREWSSIDGRLLRSLDPVPGRDIRLTIDAELQARIEQAFRRVRFEDHGYIHDHEMHGAAVVIDVPTGQVRALVSYPTYDPNLLEEQYARLARDEVNRPLFNRATQAALQPGSTVKPIVGIAAVTQGLISVHDTIECTGYLIVDGQKLTASARCWTAKRGAEFPELIPHHKIPSSDPHPTGFLNLPEAIQRSCNVYFETLGDRLGLAGLSAGFRQFGLGRPTGIGIPESAGLIPDSADGPMHAQRSIRWFAAIGQSRISATPIQMANVAATIARDGLWLRPTLLVNPDDAPAAHASIPQRVQLPVDPAALAAVREGMIRAVNTVAGTGRIIRRTDVLVAGKTGTAEAAPLSLPALDAAGRPMLDASGRRMLYQPVPNSALHPNPALPWYCGFGKTGTELSHAWFIGFAPARNPRIAFAVMLEYGGGGGQSAGIIADELLDACIEHRYLEPTH